MALTRDLLKFSKLCNITEFTEISHGGSLKKFPLVISARTSKHWNPKYSWLRGKKFIHRVLPYTKEAQNQRATFIKNLGIYPRYWKPRPLTITSASEIMEPYTPVPGDGKVSKLSGAKSLVTDTKSKVADITAMRKIKNYEANFSPDIFVQEAQDIYIKAHTVLMKNDIGELSQYVTEKAIEEMREGLKYKTLRWKFIESLEPPKIVQSRTSEVVIKTNLFAQVTVRFHTRQTLAIYDRFGRLMYGSEILAKDVLEYVVFEKHINNQYGVWRLHGKIIPEWVEPPEQSARTYVVQEEKEEEEDEDPLFDGIPQQEYTETAEVAQQETKPAS